MFYEREKKAILKVFRDITFPDPFFSSEDVSVNDEIGSSICQKLEKELQEHFHYAYGATKIVFIPKEDDYVIKIPFTDVSEGFDYDYDEETDEYYKESDKENSAPLLNAYLIEEKIYSWNYCEAECQLYNRAKEEELEDLFAKIEYIGRTKKGHPIYIAQKIEYLEDNLEPSENSLKIAKTIKIKQGTNLDIELTFLSFVIDCYGIDIGKKLCKFCKKYNINDIDEKNTGITAGGAPCIFDYSGFHD